MSTYPNAPGHRGVDTSIAAALSLIPSLGHLQRKVLEAIAQAGHIGLTADELSAKLGRDRWSVQPRTSELRLKGLIRDSGSRRLNRSGRRAIVWVAV